jgi:uncharacterized protein (UPF0548 family)
MRFLWRPDPVKLAGLIPAVHGEPFSYLDVGATASSMPAGYHRVESRSLLGHGESAFHAATAALMSWDMHRGAGMTVAASAPVPAVGVTSVMGISFGPVGLAIPCRVVWVLDEPKRRGFAYGTLPGHPERGEEAFVVERGDDDAVHLTIRAFSRAGNLLVRLGGPVPRMIQAHVTGRYEASLRATTNRTDS